MPRDGSAVYSAPAGTIPQTPNTPIESADWNSLVADLVDDANAARPITAGGTGATTAVGAHDNLSTKGSDVATAATLNLNNATGAFVDLTGTTTVTAVTLTNGRQRKARAVAAFQLTASASLIVNGSTTVNYTTVAGDLLLFEGYASSVVRVWVLASGSAPVGGPTSSTDNAIARFDGTTGKLIQNSSATIDDSGNVTAVAGTFTGRLQGKGTTTNDDASAGQIGEVQTASLAAGSAVGLGSSTPADVTFMIMGEGDWDVWGFVNFTTAAGTSVTRVQGSISDNSGTLDSSAQALGGNFFAAVVPGATSNAFRVTVGPVRKKIANGVGTNVYLVALGGFTVNTLSAWGTIYARRVR
jgi:hypothetical protein